MTVYVLAVVVAMLFLLLLCLRSVKSCQLTGIFIGSLSLSEGSKVFDAPKEISPTGNNKCNYNNNNRSCKLAANMA